jgi:CRISPR-associated protein Csd1
LSWFSNLVETYEKVSSIAGIADDKGNVLLPLDHMMKKTDVCVTLDGDGRFRHAEASPFTIMIPCTESSSTRVGSIPHPLHDELSYLAIDTNRKRAYLQQLAGWRHTHPKVEAVYKYITEGTICDDLIGSIPAFDFHNTEKAKKLFIRFRVEITGDLIADLWKDINVIEAWHTFCAVNQTENPSICYVSGKPRNSVAKHPKSINPSAANAKLISCNDETNYTFRGRFTKPEQANAISAEASHYAHAMLKYLIATQGYKCDSQAVVAWSIEDGSAQPNPFAATHELYPDDDLSETEQVNEAKSELAADYAKKLRLALLGMGNIHGICNDMRRVSVLAVDAATTGRMGVTFYQELSQNAYLERIVAWHETCRWWFRINKRAALSTPGANRIIAAVYGEPKGEGYAKIQKQAREKLLHDIFCAEPLDRGWVTAAVARVNNPFSYSKQDGGWDKGKWQNAVNVVCAMVRKYYAQKKEEYPLELDIKCTDRDYLFGRLLALADRLEGHARYVQASGNDSEKRPTNAVRYLSAFTSKPLRTWKLIYEQLNPYIQRLNGAEWYQRQIDAIMQLFGDGDICDKPLGGKYLLGYSLQRLALYNKKEEDTHESDEEN